MSICNAFAVMALRYTTGFGAFFGTAGVGRGFLARADVVVAAADFVGALVLLLLA